MRCGSQLTCERRGTLKPLSLLVFEALKTFRIVGGFQGVQLRSSSCFSTLFPSSKFKVSANVVDLHESSFLSSNIQDHNYDAIMETVPNIVSPHSSTSSHDMSTF